MTFTVGTQSFAHVPRFNDGGRFLPIIFLKMTWIVTPTIELCLKISRFQARVRVLKWFDHFSKNLKQLNRLCGCSNLRPELLVNGTPIYLMKRKKRILFSKGFPKNCIVLLRSIRRHALAAIRPSGNAAQDDIGGGAVCVHAQDVWVISANNPSG